MLAIIDSVEQTTDTQLLFNPMNSLQNSVGSLIHAYPSRIDLSLASTTLLILSLFCIQSKFFVLG
jgi:hypothetical protein